MGVLEGSMMNDAFVSPGLLSVPLPNNGATFSDISANGVGTSLESRMSNVDNRSLFTHYCHDHYELHIFVSAFFSAAFVVGFRMVGLTSVLGAWVANLGQREAHQSDLP